MKPSINHVPEITIEFFNLHGSIIKRNNAVDSTTEQNSLPIKTYSLRVCHIIYIYVYNTL